MVLGYWWCYNTMPRYCHSFICLRYSSKTWSWVNFFVSQISISFRLLILFCATICVNTSYRRSVWLMHWCPDVKVKYAFIFPKIYAQSTNLLVVLLLDVLIIALYSGFYWLGPVWRRHILVSHYRCNSFDHVLESSFSASVSWR